MARTNAGTIGCLCCGETIPVKEKENGTLSVSCPWCDFSAYARPGTQAHGLISAKIKRAPAPVEAEKLPPFVPVPTLDVARVIDKDVKPKRVAFSLDQLTGGKS